MPSLSEHQSAEFTKMILMGDSGTGKTGSLASLVKDGYKLRILDFDNGLDILSQAVRRIAPEKLDNVEFRTLRDKRKGTPSGSILDGPPKTFTTALAMLDRWKYDSVDLGPPAEFGPECIVVLDSLTFLGKAAYNWAYSMNPGAKDNRQHYWTAQQAIENVLSQLTSESFRTNVIVISHINYMDLPDGAKKGFPTSIGSAQGPDIPGYFNSVAQCRTQGGKRTVQTVSTALVDLKNPASFSMAPTLSIEDGLANFFKTVRGK